MLRVVTDEAAGAEMLVGLDEIVREGAQRMLAAALVAEADAYVDALSGELDDYGHRPVIRNGTARPRVITTAAGGVEITAPRVNDRRVDPETGERCRFRSSIVPPWCRKSPKVAEVLPLMYLHGLSSGDFVPALRGFFGSEAGLSASVITRLTTEWQDERRAFAKRSLRGVDYVYVWADGIHFTIRLEEARLCALVIVGVRADGTKELVAIADGLRESTESCADLLRDRKRRGMRAPVVAVGDGALGFWGALGDVFAETRHQRCWVHKAKIDVESKLPDRLASTVAKKIRAAYHNPDALAAEATLEDLARQLAKNHPGAAESLREGLSETLTVTRLGVPPTLARTLRSTNAVESIIEICRDHSTNVKRWRDGQMTLRWCAAGMLEAAQQFRRVNGFLHLPVLRDALNRDVVGTVTPPCQDEHVAA